VFELIHSLSWAAMFFIFVIFGGIFATIFDFTIWRVFLRFISWIWVLGRASSSISNIRVNPWLYLLRFYRFLLVPLKRRFLSSSKIGRKIFGFERNLFWKFVPCVEVTLVSKFHPIWYPIAQESSLERNGRILGENHIFIDLLPDIVWPSWTMYGPTG
jgi:hypothetical protein